MWIWVLWASNSVINTLTQVDLFQEERNSTTVCVLSLKSTASGVDRAWFSVKEALDVAHILGPAVYALQSTSESEACYKYLGHPKQKPRPSSKLIKLLLVSRKLFVINDLFALYLFPASWFLSITSKLTRRTSQSETWLSLLYVPLLLLENIFSWGNNQPFFLCNPAFNGSVFEGRSLWGTLVIPP